MLVKKWILLFLVPVWAGMAGAETASISGVVQSGTSTLGGGKVVLSSQFREPRVSDTGSVDRTGRFAFKDLAPGWYTVGLMHPIEVRTSRASTMIYTSSHSRSVYLDSGEQADVALVGTGKTVTGRFVLPEGTPVKVGWQSGHTRRMSMEVDKTRPPVNLMGDALDDWYESYHRSADFIKAFESQTDFVVDIERDGTFSVEHVPPGEYTIVADFRSEDDELDARPAAEVYTTCTVAEGAGDLDLGDVPVKVTARAIAAAQGYALAPPLVVDSLDGKRIRLSDYKGKYVLLDFWAVWCGPCRGETPYLKEVWEKYGDRHDFAMVGLSLDKDINAPRKYVAEHGLGWTHGFLGDWGKTDIPGSFGVDTIPRIFLIGPNGEIIEKNLRLGRIMKAVDRAMAPGAAK